MSRQVQAVAQEEAIISVNESLELVQCLLRVSVFHVAFLRGLFPDSHFKGTSMDNLEGMEIKMLRPKCDDSATLIKWVEEGVRNAIECGYLKTLIFGIALDPEGTKLMEEYIFTFTYDVHGAVSMKLQGKGKQPRSASQASLNSVRYQVIRLMRMLVQLCNTLERVPEERYLFMKLTYHDSTPDEYEPPGFQARLEEAPPYFTRKPFSMSVGEIATNFHAVTLKLKSVLDGCGDLVSEDGMYAEQQESAFASGTTGLESSEPGEQRLGNARSAERRPSVIIEEVEHVDESLLQGAVTQEVPLSFSRPQHQALTQPRSADTETTCDPAVEQVKQYCLQRKKVDIATTALHFNEYDADHLSRALEQLVIDGVLKRTASGGAFRVCGQPTSSASIPTPAEDDAAGRNDSSESGASKKGRPRKMSTKQSPGLRAARAPATPASKVEQEDLPVLDSQQAEEQGAKRKASYVLEAIHQKRRMPAMRARSRLTSMCK